MRDRSKLVAPVISSLFRKSGESFLSRQNTCFPASVKSPTNCGARSCAKGCRPASPVHLTDDSEEDKSSTYGDSSEEDTTEALASVFGKMSSSLLDFEDSSKKERQKGDAASLKKMHMVKLDFCYIFILMMIVYLNCTCIIY